MYLVAYAQLHSVVSSGCFAPWSTYKVKGGVIVNVADKVKGAGQGQGQVC
jgi:hypothetical protein